MRSFKYFFRSYCIGVLSRIVLASSATLTFFCGTGCHNHSISKSYPLSYPIDSLIPIYSHGFKVYFYTGYKVVLVYGYNYKGVAATYILPDFNTAVSMSDTSSVLSTPINKVVCLSTTHVGALALLDARDIIAGVANKDLIYDTIVSHRTNRGNILDIGSDYQPSYEKIAMIKPNLIFCDGENASSSQLMTKLESLGVVAVSSRDYYEQDPLARAEWIKFFGAFINQSTRADSIFKIVERRYKSLKDSGVINNTHPSVFCNIPYNDIWYMPCRDNYTSRLIRDAGGDFLWSKDTAMNGLNLTLTFEQVYNRASDAKIWLNTGTLTSLTALEREDEKFKLFKALKEKRVFNSNKRATSNGGQDMWESGPFLPHLVLKDLQQIFEGRDSNLYYYQRLK